MDRFKRGSRKNQESFSDYTLLFIVLFLLAFGLVMLYSTSAYDANLTYNDSTYLFRKQIFSTLAGLVVLFIVSHLPYHIWERFAVLGYGVSVALILLIIPFGIEANGAKRWLRVFGVSLQPAEVAKLAMILFLAYLICKLGRNIRTMKGFFVVLGSAVPMSGLIYVITRNLSSAIIIMGIAAVMLFVACPDYKRFIILGIIGIAGVAAVVFLIIEKCLKAEALVVSVESVFWHGEIRRLMQAARASRPCRRYMRSVPEESLVRVLDRVCRSLVSFRKHRMI